MKVKGYSYKGYKKLNSAYAKREEQKLKRAQRRALNARHNYRSY